MRDLHALDGDIARVDEHLDSHIGGVIEPSRERGIEIMTGRERLTVSPLDYEHDDGSVTVHHHGFEFAQMLQRPSGDAIGKLGEAGCSH